MLTSQASLADHRLNTVSVINIYNCIYRDTYLGIPQVMWPQYRNPLLAFIFLFSLSTSVVSLDIARFTEYGWVEAFDRTSPQVEGKALGGGAMQVPMNGNSKGWWARWLAVGGEGDVTVHVSKIYNTSKMTLTSSCQLQTSHYLTDQLHSPRGQTRHSTYPYLVDL